MKYKYVLVRKFKNNPEPEVIGVKHLDALTALLVDCATSKYIEGFQPYEFEQAKKLKLHLLVEVICWGDDEPKKRKPKRKK